MTAANKPADRPAPRRDLRHRALAAGRPRPLGGHRRRPDLAHAGTRARTGQNVTPAALTPWSKVGIIDASHFDAETAYAAVDRHRLDDFKPYIYRTHDGGKHWDPIANGIPDGSFVNAVREDPVRKGLLYAGTEKGVYVSFDDGDHWQPLQLEPAGDARCATSRCTATTS